MSPQLTVSCQWMNDFLIVEKGGLEEYFTYWHVISVISLRMQFLFMYFQSILIPFKVGIVLTSLKDSEIDRVSRGALSFVLHAVIVMRAVMKCQSSSCGWRSGVLDRHVPFPCTIHRCACTAEKMDLELLSVIWNMTSTTWWLTSQNDSACAPANFMPMQLQLDTNYKFLGGVFSCFHIILWTPLKGGFMAGIRTCGKLTELEKGTNTLPGH